MNIRNVMAAGVAALVALPLASTAALGQGPHGDAAPMMMMRTQS